MPTHSGYACRRHFTGSRSTCTEVSASLTGKFPEEGRVSEISQFKAEFFKALAHPLRIRILDILRKGEAGVNELSLQLKVEQSNLSQQLAVLRGRNIVVGRKEGNNVYYSVRDPEIFRLLDVAKKIFNNSLIDVRDMLSQLKTVRPGGR
jgi:DNA-binding transcriptional ArsR family regulator